MARPSPRTTQPSSWLRALVFVVAATMGACRPDAGAVVAADPVSVRIRVGAAATTTTARPASPTPTSTCFAEPATYTKHVVPAPVPADADTRLRLCGALAAEARAACRFAVARAYFDAKHFERAGPLFLAIAHDPSASDAAVAARLALESMNMLVSFAEPSRASCSDLMAEEVPKLLFELCTPAPRPGAEDACAMLHIVDVNLAYCSECPAVTISGRDRDSAYVAAAQIYLDLATDRCIFGKGRPALDEELRCSELLYEAYSAFSKGHAPLHAAQAKAMLLDPKNGLQKTEPAKRLAKP